MKLKVGDKVRIRKDLEVNKKYGNLPLYGGIMSNLRGNVCTITGVSSEGNFEVKENPFYWSKEMLEPVKDHKLIFRDNVTILLKNGKRYVTKCQAGDTYDREKGLLLCLAKANGYTYNDICEMLNNAEYQGEKPYKITLSEFWANKGKKDMAIHCKTDNEADELLKVFDRMRQVWLSGDKYTEINMSGKDVCYTNNNTFYNYIKFYEFNEVDLSK